MAIPRVFKKVTFRQLEIFAHLAQKLNFTTTANELFLAQPTVSFQIKKLEEALDRKLFMQFNRQVHLTDEGFRLLETCKDIFTSLQQYESDSQAGDEQVIRELSLAGVTTTEYILPRIFYAFKQIYPDIRVSLNVFPREIIFSRLDEDLDELYFIDRLPDGFDDVSVPYIDNPLVVIASADHRLAGERDIPIKELAHEKLLLREPASGTHLAIKQFFSDKGIRLTVEMELSSNEAIKRCVMNDLGISILSKYAVSSELRRRELIELRFKGFPIFEKWHVVYSKDRMVSAASSEFLNYLKSDGRRIIESSVH